MSGRAAAPASAEAAELEVRARERASRRHGRVFSCPGFVRSETDAPARAQRWKAELEAELRRREATPVAPTLDIAAKADGGAALRGLDATSAPPTPQPAPAPVPDSASVVNKLREEGNARMRAGDPARAAELYSEALRPAATGKPALRFAPAVCGFVCAAFCL